MWLGIIFCISTIFFDFKYRKFPNSLFLTGFVLFTYSSWITERPNLTSCLIAALLLFLFHLFFYSKGMMGAGDVKCAAIIGLIFGFSLDALYIILISSFLVFARFCFFNLMQGKSLTESVGIIKNGVRLRVVPYAGYMGVSGLVVYANHFFG